MSYQRPMVLVYQEYESTGTTTTTTRLPACIVGPCYHIVDPVEDETLALYGQYTKQGIISGFIPNNIPGSLIEKESFKLRFKNAVVELKSDAASKEIKDNNYVLEDATIAANVQIGDIVSFGTNKELRVIGVNTETGTLVLNRICPGNGPVSIQRKVEEFTLDYTAEGVSLDLTSERFTVTGVTYTVDTVPYYVVSAELYVGYRALRQGLSGLLTIYNMDELTGKLGKVCPDNPLAFGVSIALANGTDGVMCVGVDSDDLKGYTATKNAIEYEDPVYGIVPLTFDTGVLTMFKNHCVEFSKPEISKWRMAFGCTRLATDKIVCTSKGKVSKDGDGDLVILTCNDTNVEFMSSGIEAGDILTLTDTLGEEHNYLISSVASEDILTINQSEPFDAKLFLANGTEYKFSITHHMTLEEQAQWIAAASTAYGDRHFVNIFPDICIVDGQELPGYYLGCAVASGVASLPSHYGMTRLSVSGISGVRNSSDHFNNSQLDIIAGGGTLIFVQANSTAAPYIRHQLTTDMSAVEYQELSFVKNYDYVSYACRDVLDTYLGRWNITTQLMDSIYTTLHGTLETIKLDSQARIGSRLLDFRIVSIGQMEDVRDRVEAVVEVSMPYPLNTIGLHLQSVFLQVTASGV